MIRYVKGDLLDSKADAIVIPVNSVGVMGAGLALQYKVKYPLGFKHYKYFCDKGKLRVGLVVVSTGVEEKLHVYFATKDHWKQPSFLEDIQHGLHELHELARRTTTHPFKTIAMPKLGCGKGQLEWEDVHKLIVNEFVGDPDITIELYGEEL